MRVAKSIQDARHVRRGEILVAPVTDVAVVAQEYGLRCVVNTLVATKVLKTGDRIRVDGDRGVVTRIGEVITGP